jgi:hypothetical protein
MLSDSDRQPPAVVRQHYCHKIAYPDREVADWYRPFREAALGMPLWPYRCQSKACRRLRCWHLTSKGSRWDRKRASKAANKAAKFSHLAQWYDDGGLVPGVNRW